MQIEKVEILFPIDHDWLAGWHNENKRERGCDSVNKAETYHYYYNKPSLLIIFYTKENNRTEPLFNCKGGTPKVDSHHHETRFNYKPFGDMINEFI